MTNVSCPPFHYRLGLDTVEFKMKITPAQKRLLLKRILRRVDIDERQCFTARHHRGLRIWLYGPALTVRCSAATFMQRHNAWGLPLLQIPDFIRASSEILGIEIMDAELRRYDLALDLGTDQPSSSYMKLIGRHQHYGRTHFPDDGGSSLGNLLRRYTQYAKDEYILNLEHKEITDRDGLRYYRDTEAQKALESTGSHHYVRMDISTRRKGLFQMSSKGTRMKIRDLLNPGIHEAVLQRFFKDMEEATFENARADDMSTALIGGKDDRDALATRLLIENIGVEGYRSLLVRSYRSGKMSKSTLKKMRAELKHILQSMSKVEDDLATEFSTKLFTGILMALDSLKELPGWETRVVPDVVDESLMTEDDYEEFSEENQEFYEGDDLDVEGENEHFEDEYDSNDRVEEVLV